MRAEGCSRFTDAREQMQREIISAADILCN